MTLNRFKSAPAVLLRLVFALCLLAAVNLGGAAFAQTAGPDLDSLRRDIQGVDSGIAENTANDDRLVRLRQDIDGLSRKLIEFGVSFRPRLAEIATKSAELGAPPKEGESPETAEKSGARSALANEKSAINALLAEAESLSVRLTRSADRIGDLRRELFTNALLRQTAATGAFSADTAQAFSQQLSAAWRTIRSRSVFVWNFKTRSALGAGAISAILIALAIAGASRYLAPAFSPRRGDENRSYISRLSLAFWSTVIPSIGVAAALAMLDIIQAYFGLFAGQSAEILNALLVSIAAIYFIQRLSFAIFSPRHAGLRLLNVTTPAASALVFLTVLMAVVHIADYFLSRLDDISLAPLSLTVAKSLIASLTISLILIAIALVKPFADAKSRRALPWPVYFRLPLILLAAVVIGAALSGYIGMARFLAAQIVVTGAILATMFIGMRSGRVLAKEGGFAQTGLGLTLKERLAMSDNGADLTGLVSSFLVYGVVILAGLPLIALQWGFKWPDISGWLYRLLTDIRIGSISISLIAVLFGLAVFAAGILLTRKFQRWLDSDVMRRSRVDSGVRNSIRTVAGYAGIGLAGLIGLSAAGFNLSNLAIVAGALSLGIGFGLQNIVSNFVSGLILLVERPFRVGDWIESGKVTGFVRKISVRATEIETFHGQTVILPNSEFINNAVSNWTLRNNIGRIDIPVGVAYGTDPQRVEAILMQIAVADPDVVKRPEPFVLFKGFGESSLDFELRAHLADILNSPIVMTRMRMSILTAFAENLIQIPVPQRDVRLGLPEIQALSGAIDAIRKKPETTAKARNRRSRK